MPERDHDTPAPRRDRVRREIGGRLDALRLTMMRPGMRRLQLSSLGFNTGEFAVTVALGVFAFDEGGPAAVGIVTLLRTLPGIVFGPSLAVLTDRLARQSVLAAGLVARAAATGGVVLVLLADGPPGLVYALAALDAAMASSFFPAAIAAVPELCNSAEELSAANATSAVMEHGGVLFGPILAGLILSFAAEAVVFATSIGLYLVAALLAAGIATDRRLPEPRAGAGLLDELGGGLQYLRQDRSSAVVVGLWAFESIAVGATEVFVVVLALDVLALGDPGVGWLGAILGAGGLIGAVSMATLGRSTPFGRYLGIAVFTMGVAFALSGLLPRLVVVAIALGTAGVAQSQADVAAQTLLQRRVPEAMLGRVLGLFEGLYWGSLGLGAAAASFLTVAAGPRSTLIAVGVTTAVVALATRTTLIRIDRHTAAPEDRISVLATSSMFGVLGVPTIERLARSATDEEHEPGSVIVREGERGDRFYLIVEGEVGVVAGDVPVTTLGAGDYFGEIALLKGTPRIATITALTPLRLLSLEGRRFLEAVASRTTTSEEAESVAVSRMVQTGRLRRGRMG